MQKSSWKFTTDSAQEEEEEEGRENIPQGSREESRARWSGAKPASQRDLPKEVGGGWGGEEGIPLMRQGPTVCLPPTPLLCPL